MSVWITQRSCQDQTSPPSPSSAPDSQVSRGTSLVFIAWLPKIMLKKHPKMMVFFISIGISGVSNYGVMFWGVWIFCFLTWMIREFAVKLESFGLIFPAWNVMNISGLYQVISSRGWHKFSMIDLCIHYAHLLYTMYLLGQKFHPQANTIPTPMGETSLRRMLIEWDCLLRAQKKRPGEVLTGGRDSQNLYMHPESKWVCLVFFFRFSFG